MLSAATPECIEVAAGTAHAGEAASSLPVRAAALHSWPLWGRRGRDVTTAIRLRPACAPLCFHFSEGGTRGLGGEAGDGADRSDRAHAVAL